MKLQIESIDIEEAKTGSKTFVSNHMLYLDPRELEKIILKDERIKSVEINLVYPGDKVRVVNVVDVIQPRCKIGRDNEDFPGYQGKLTIAGKGRTRSLRGISVILSNSYSKRSYSSLIDMFGIGAEISRYGSMKNISIHPIPSEHTDERDFESAVKLAGLKTAVYLAQAAEWHTVDEVEVFDLDKPNLERNSNLSRVVYYYQLHTPQHDYQGIADPVLYGSPVTDLLPTVIHPNEILDGGVITTHTVRGLDTYSIQNHAVVKELYKRHGKELIFAGVVIGAASVEPIQRQRMSMMAANLISNVFGADGVILTKVHGGVPNVDLSLVGEACEDLGIKTTLLIHMQHHKGSIADSLLFSTDSLNAIINVGAILERIRLPQAEKIVGGTEETPIYSPDFAQKAGDKVVEIEEFLLAGLYDHVGGSRVISIEY
jgi:glycine reductase